ncbi:RNA-directed DNA polymerase, eukaryota [Artemisia annua]|uniref:RNA-directed DNA polymerase, eukaryota n=1 Tax=Artemisia annua TaxID=35608 RepID=A0A2U1LY74_ARTAN|nr:RNA-directed DNA polymerase, eukaryota [Artemisia annua]
MGNETSDLDDCAFIQSLWGNQYCDFAVQKPQGVSGGIIAMWDVSLFKKYKVLDDGKGFIAIFGEWPNLGIDCLMLVVYAPQDASKKRSLWTRLRDLILHFHAMTIVLSDFNEVRSESEILSSIFCKSGAKAFNDFIIESDLVDLPMGGRKFTRINKFGTKLSKIDRILVSHHFVSLWPNAQLVALPRHLSDHCPLLLKSHSGVWPHSFQNFKLMASSW